MFFATDSDEQRVFVLPMRASFELLLPIDIAVCLLWNLRRRVSWLTCTGMQG